MNIDTVTQFMIPL